MHKHWQIWQNNILNNNKYKFEYFVIRDYSAKDVFALNLQLNSVVNNMKEENKNRQISL
jgi:hypothetical protein